MTVERCAAHVQMTSEQAPALLEVVAALAASPALAEVLALAPTSQGGTPEVAAAAAAANNMPTEQLQGHR